MHDPVGRRGIWYRTTPHAFETTTFTSIELAGGREGDDAYAKLEVGHTVTAEDLRAIEDVLSRSAWVREENREEG